MKHLYLSVMTIVVLGIASCKKSEKTSDSENLSSTELSTESTSSTVSGFTPQEIDYSDFNVDYEDADEDGEWEEVEDEDDNIYTTLRIAHGSVLDDEDLQPATFDDISISTTKCLHPAADTHTIRDLSGNYYHLTTDGYGNTTGFDNDGNYYNFHTDDCGNTTGFDSNGNYMHSHTDNYGNTTGFDSNGNYYHYHTDDYGNTTGFNGDGSYVSAHTDDFGNTTINIY